MFILLVYLFMVRVLGWLALRERSDAVKDAEILVLRHKRSQTIDTRRWHAAVGSSSSRASAALAVRSVAA